jgi:magnesium transporter
MSKRKHRARRARRKKPSTRPPAGALPGIVSVPAGALPTSARLVAYDETGIVEHPVSDPASLRAELAKHRVVWVDVTGLADADLITGIGRAFELHPLALEDTVHTHQRAKLDEYAFGYYLALRMPCLVEGCLELEQISLFLGDSFVVTFQERPGESFDAIRERIRKSHGRLRRSGPDYLAYALLDALVDSYFPYVEAYGDRLEELEDRILADPDHTVISAIHEVKRDLLSIRRGVWPLREALNLLLREDHTRITPETRVYLRDVYDHTIQLVELTETQRELASGLLDVYLSSVSNRMNEIMKVLTIIATIFIPLSFVAGLYGMNFDVRRSPLNMPELEWRYGYLFALGLMAAIAIGMLVYFRRKRWI